jgi:hypothetical protein
MCMESVLILMGFYFLPYRIHSCTLQTDYTLTYGPTSLCPSCPRAELSGIPSLQQVGCILRVLGTVLPIKLTDTSNIKIIKIQSSVKSIGKCKKKSLYNQPKPYFVQKIIVKSFLDRFLQIFHQS